MQEQRGGGSPRMNNTRRWLATGAMRQWPGVDGVRIHGSAGHGACVWRECGVGLGAVAGRFRPRPRGAGRGRPTSRSTATARRPSQAMQGRLVAAREPSAPTTGCKKDNKRRGMDDRWKEGQRGKLATFLLHNHPKSHAFHQINRVFEKYQALGGVNHRGESLNRRK